MICPACKWDYTPEKHEAEYFQWYKESVDYIKRNAICRYCMGVLKVLSPKSIIYYQSNPAE